jgi:enoyl-CoA hydratase/carnithine racemase
MVLSPVSEEIPMSYDQILYAVDENYVATITLNRSEKLNSWTPVMAEEVHDALHKAADDDAVRVIVITGAGRGFCSGADMAELKNASGQGTGVLTGGESPEEAVTILMGTKTEEQRGEPRGSGTRSDFKKRYSYLPAIPKPIIAAINGPAAGLGLIIALYCDLRLASQRAIFSTAFARRGLIAEHGIGWLLPRIVGLSNAFDLLFSARPVDADEAFRMGLVNRVFEESAFMSGVREYAESLATFSSPRSLGVMKKQLWESPFQTLAEACGEADRELVRSLGSEDFREGVAHFVEKRPPKFTGK